jgi:amino acid adenylation domain-containing protein
MENDVTEFSVQITAEREHTPTKSFIEFQREDIERSIPDRFERQVRQHPGRLAVNIDGSSLTYHELNQAANRVSHAILAQDCNSDEPVALLFKQGVSLIVASLGVLKAGKAYVPVDYSIPPAKVTHILNDFEPRLILADKHNLSLAHKLASGSREVFNVDALDAQLPETNPGLPISPDDLAYIHYTSGSTGEPKGVVENHRNELHNIMTNTNALRISPDDRISLVRANNVGATRDTLLALLNGAALFPLDIKESLADLARWLIEKDITVFTCVTSIFRHAVKDLNEKEQFPRLRLIHVGGEAISKADVDLYKKHFSDECLFVSRLGLSETETLTYYFINKQTEIKGDRVPVGYPLEGNEILLLDEEGREIGANQVGEIAVKSRYLALGYWRQPELTRAKFVTDPKRGPDRIYFTGDLGYRLPDGCLVHVGRKDFQVKIRGYRVEVPSVEMALLELAGIKQAVVIPWEEMPSTTRLVAYIVVEPGHGPTMKQLHESLKVKLPDYMRPSFFVVLDSLPLTANGKVDRKALPPPAHSRCGLDTPYVAASAPVEKALIHLWAEVMGIEGIGIHDNFSELGGDSLLAAQIASRINAMFPLKRPLNSLFEAPTVAQLSEYLREQETNPGQSTKIANLLLKVEEMSPEEIINAVVDMRGKGSNV